MKKIVSIIISLLIFIPSVKPLADGAVESNTIYNYMIESSTRLGEDNFSNNSYKSK